MRCAILLAALASVTISPAADRAYAVKGWTTFAAGAVEFEPGEVHLDGVRLRLPHRAVPEGMEIGSRGSYRRIVYRRVWRGIDLEFYWMGANLEYDVVALAGAHLDDAVLDFEGASLNIDDSGGLLIENPGHKIRSPRPVAIAERGARVSVRYRLLGSGRMGFTANGWDGKSTLRIDPTLVFGGSFFSNYDQIGWQFGYGMFRVTNPYQRHGALLVDHNGAALMAVQLNGFSNNYAAMVRQRGSAQDTVNFSYSFSIAALAEDPAGGYWVTGSAAAGTIPVKAAAYRSAPIGTSGGALIHYTSDLSTIDYATYLDFVPIAMTLDASRQIYLAGTADPSTPTTAGAWRSPQTSGSKAAVLKLSADGKTARYLALVGGSGYDEVTSIAADAQGSAAVGGLTTSPDLATPGAFQTTAAASQGLQHGFVARLSADGTKLIAATYLGGGSYDEVRGLQIASNGEVVAEGMTRSGDFPAPERPLGAVDPTITYMLHGFIVRLSPALNAMTWGALLAGAPLAEVSAAPDDHFVFAAGPYHSAPAAADALMGASAYINQVGGALMEFNTDTGALVYSGGLWQSYGYFVPMISAGANGVVAAAATTTDTSFPLYNSATWYYTTVNSPHLAILQFGDTAPVPSTVLVQGMTASAPTAEGDVQFGAPRRPVGITPGAVAAPWLNLSAGAIFTPGSIHWRVTPAGLAPGAYTASVPLTSSSGKSQPNNIAFRLCVDQLKPSPGQISASVTQGQTATVRVRVPAVCGVPFRTASDQPWLSASASGGVSPAEFSVQLGSVDLSPGTYTANLTLTPNGAAADAVQIPVTLTVN